MKIIQLIEPVQVYLILIKLAEILLFFFNIKSLNDRYKVITWSKRPQIYKCLLIGMMGWFMFITIDLFIFLLASLSFTGVMPGNDFTGYNWDYPSLFFANILRDFSTLGGLILLSGYFLASLSLRYGKEKISHLLRNRWLQLLAKC